MAGVSFFTPTSAGSVPPPSLATGLLPAFGQGLLQAAKTYQAGKAIDQAAKQAEGLFNDPTYGQIFRSLGMAALQQGQDPTPIISQMLNTAITLKRDEQKMAQQERLMNLQYGQSVGLENLRTSNNLMEAERRAELQADYMSPEAVSRREQAQTIGRLSGQATFMDSEMGRNYSTMQGNQEMAKNQAMIDRAAEMERAKIQVRKDEGVLPADTGSTGLGTLFEDAGIDPDEPLPDTLEDLEAMEMDVITASESSPDARRALAPRLQAIRNKKKNAPEAKKGPNVSERANRYITP